MPPAGPSNVIPAARVNPFTVLFLALLVGVVVLAWYAAHTPEPPIPTPPSREASLERQVGALSTHVVELEWRNAATLKALDSFERPTPTPTYIYIGPGEERAR